MPIVKIEHRVVAIDRRRGDRAQPLRDAALDRGDNARQRLRGVLAALQHVLGALKGLGLEGPQLDLAVAAGLQRDSSDLRFFQSGAFVRGFDTMINRIADKV